jgi:very-short-patch-repair endonuclease
VENGIKESILNQGEYKVVRFWNNQVENDINGVIRAIEFALKED